MTLQKPDILKYKGTEVRIWGNILFEYFENYPERLIRTPGLITSLQRGYFAQFEVNKNNELIIISLKRYIDFDKEKGDFIPETILDKAFPNSKKCEFFSSYIRIDNNYKNMEDSEFKLLEFENGNLIKEHSLTKSELNELKKEKTVYNNVYSS